MLSIVPKYMLGAQKEEGKKKRNGVPQGRTQKGVCFDSMALNNILSINV